MTFSPHALDHDLDLELDREVDVPPELVWKAWTTPDLLKEWFAPKPYETPHCEIDHRPGGIFRTALTPGVEPCVSAPGEGAARVRRWTCRIIGHT